VPDPQDVTTFERSRLDWAEPAKEPHADLLDWHRRLIALRRARPELTDGRLDRVRCRYDEKARWFVLYRDRIAAVCNLAETRQAIPLEGAPAGVLLASVHGFAFRPQEVEVEGQSATIVTFVD
jgi:maltooligosyltrehalose trehalohydrolase